MKFLRREVVVCAVAGAILSGCGTRPGVVATVGTETITADDLRVAGHERIDILKEPVNVSMQERQSLLNTLIRQKALILAAKKDGFKVSVSSGTSPDLVLFSFYSRRLEMDLRPTDQDIQAYYEQHRDHFDQPLEHGNQVFAQTMDEAQKAQALLASGSSFEDAAWRTLGLKEKPLHDASEMRPFRKGDRSPEFERAFFALQPGQVSGIVQVSPSAYVILKRTEPQKNVPYAQIHDEIRDFLTTIAVEKKIKELIAAAPVNVDEKKLAELRF